MKEEWSTGLIGEVTNIINGGTPKSGVAEYWGGDVLWITPKDMGKLDSNYVSDTSRTITEQGLGKSSAKLIPENSVILSTRAPIGHLVINTKPMATNQGCRGLVPSSTLSTKYLLHFLRLNVSLLNDLGSGTTFKELSKTALASVEIPLPSLPEQKRIVAILDEAFEGIDRAVANAEKNLANARELFESYLNKVFTEKGDGWVEKMLGDVCENLDSKRIPITKSKRESGDVPYYGASGVVDHVADFIFDEDLLLVSEDGANLLARTYPIAFSISGKTWVNNHAHALSFRDIHSQRFIEYYLNSISLEPYVSGMAQPKLNQKMLNSIPVPSLSLGDQCNIVGKLDELSAETKRLESIYQRKLTALSELKQSLLQKAFSGELTANDTAINKEAVA
jgi:type I restriction enzyme, S subunit